MTGKATIEEEQVAEDDYGLMTELVDLGAIRDRAVVTAMPHYRDIATLISEVERYRRWVDYLITGEKVQRLQGA